MDRVTADQMDILFNLLVWPIPPLYLQKFLDGFLIKTIPDDLGRISSGDGIRRNVSGHHGTGTDSCPVPYGNTREDGGAKSNPNVIANDHIPLCGRMPLD